MKLAHSEPAIKHSVIALSLLHQRCHQYDALKLENMQDIVMHHQKALVSARALLENAHDFEVPKVLLLCMLFVCYANHTGQYAVAQTHLTSGLKILQQHQQKLALAPCLSKSIHGAGDADIDALAESFGRLDFQAMTFSDNRAPYQYSLFPLQSRGHVSVPSVPPLFTGIGEASTCLMKLARNFMYLTDLLEKGEISRDEFVLQTAAYGEALNIWNHSFAAFQRHGVDQHGRAHGIMLAIYHLVLQSLIAFEYRGFESDWDIFLPSFAAITEKARAFAQLDATLSTQTTDAAFSFNIGTTIPLFITAIKCRDPGIRREAIRLLRERRRLEGVWDSAGAAAVAERLVVLEEQTAASVKYATDVPEEARVHSTMITAERDRKVVHATFLRRVGGLEGSWEATECSIGF